MNRTVVDTRVHQRVCVEEVGAVALDAGDRARLREIESRLIHDDPGLARKFWSWRPSSGPRPLLPGWSVVPPWALLVFLVAACTWMVSPVLGALVVVAGGIGRIATRARRTAPPHSGDSGGGRVVRGPDHRG
jgi:hypothetical protein